MTDYIQRKTLLNRSGVEWTDYNCNHYRGCRHDCRYCYARGIMKISKSEWPHVKVVGNALELAVADLRKIPAGSRIMISSCTDPYQPVEASEKLTKALISLLASNWRDLDIVLITKSSLIARDFGLIKQFPNVKVCMTITAVHALPQYEPHATPNPVRIETLSQAHALGIHTMASIEPWIPGETKPWRILHQTCPFVDEYVIGSYNHKWRPGSLPYQSAKRLYTATLPTIKEFCANHMKKLTVKEELLQWIKER